MSTHPIRHRHVCSNRLSHAEVIPPAAVAGDQGLTLDQQGAGHGIVPGSIVGPITLFDENGNDALTPAGFEGSWVDFVRLGLYNARFLDGTPGTLVLPFAAEPSSQVPYWGAGITGGGSAFVLSSTGSAVRITGAGSGNPGTYPYLASSPVPVRPAQRYHVVAHVKAGGTASVQFSVTANLDSYGADGAFISTASASAWLLPVTPVDPVRVETPPLEIADGARWVVVRLVVAQLSGSAGGTLDIEAVGVLEPTPENLTGLSPVVTNLAADVLYDPANRFKLESTTGEFSIYSENTFDAHVPVVTNDGTSNYDERTGWAMKVGKMVFVCLYVNWGAAGSGSTRVTITTPSSPDRSARQVLVGHLAGSGSNTGAITAVAFTGGSGAVWELYDRTGADVVGANLTASSLLTVQGWYREAA